MTRASRLRHNEDDNDDDDDALCGTRRQRVLECCVPVPVTPREADRTEGSEEKKRIKGRLVRTTRHDTALKEIGKGTFRCACESVCVSLVCPSVFPECV